MSKPVLRRKSTWILLILAALIAIVWTLIRPTPPVILGSGQPMQAVVYHEYGSSEVLKLETTESPGPTTIRC